MAKKSTKKAEVVEIIEEITEPTITIEEALGNSSATTVKKYLPLEVKMEMLDQIILTCLEETENGMMKINYGLKHMSLQLVLIREYTNIDLQVTDSVASYNLLCESGLMDMVIGMINKEEYMLIRGLLDDELNERQAMSNTLAGVVAKGLTKIANVVPNEKAMKKMIKSVNTIDSSKLTFVSQLIDTFKGEKSEPETKLEVVK